MDQKKKKEERTKKKKKIGMNFKRDRTKRERYLSFHNRVYA